MRPKLWKSHIVHNYIVILLYTHEYYRLCFSVHRNLMKHNVPIWRRRVRNCKNKVRRTQITNYYWALTNLQGHFSEEVHDEYNKVESQMRINQKSQSSKIRQKSTIWGSRTLNWCLQWIKLTFFTFFSHGAIQDGPALHSEEIMSKNCSL